MSLTIEVELKEFLTRLENKIDKLEAKFDNKIDQLEAKFDSKIDSLQKDVNDLKLDTTEVKTRLISVEKDVTELKTTQKNQVWAIISLLGIAIFATAVRFVFDTFPKINP